MIKENSKLKFQIIGIFSSILVTALFVIFSLFFTNLDSFSNFYFFNVDTDQNVPELGIQLNLIAIFLTIAIFIFQTILSIQVQKIIKDEKKYNEKQIKFLNQDISTSINIIKKSYNVLKQSTYLLDYYRTSFSYLEQEKIYKKNIDLQLKNFSDAYYKISKTAEYLQGFDIMSSRLVSHDLKQNFKELSIEFQGSFMEENSKRIKKINFKKLDKIMSYVGNYITDTFE